MSNHHTLTKLIDKWTFMSELATEGVTAGYSMNDLKLTFSGPVWDGMDASTQTAEIAMVATVETAHVPPCFTEVTLAAAPHHKSFVAECEAVTGVNAGSVGYSMPTAYPGSVVIHHNVLTAGQQANLVTAAEAHDPTAYPSLAVGGVDVRVYAADNVATGAVVVTDSRGASANGKVVKLRIPTGGDGDVDVDQVTLSGVGQGTFNFQETTRFTPELLFEAYLDDDSADPVRFKVRRGTA